ncbi:unnamed protein product [Blepharisma stoltei]|uniref:Cytoplasmic dynein 2 light intermediate chain 1 n=1 Tax=Blepharisma stoltei TaxID=1481888 RepID=A0AAU9JVY7_9CILI|nr:unnamed protein product [Blepharisma stoltei]
MIPDIWALSEQTASQESTPSERTIFVLGERKSGKSTLVNNFISQSSNTEEPRPTVALEYSYARAPLGINSTRDLGYIYELGGGRLLANLVSVPMTAETLSELMIVIVIDLSHPYKVIDSLLYWLQVVRNRINEILSHLPPKEAQKYQKRIAKKWNKHEDSARLEPIPVPVYVAATKYDVFCDQESENRKWMARALRYFCHKNGISLFYWSARDQKLVGALRMVLSYHLFGSPIRKQSQKDHAQAILVSSGEDSFQSIGPPPNVSKGSHGNQDEEWMRAIQQSFPKPNRK